VTACLQTFGMQAHALWSTDIRGKSMWTTTSGPHEEAPTALEEDRDAVKRAQDLTLPLYFDGQLW
jgi:hypothetical protein